MYVKAKNLTHTAQILAINTHYRFQNILDAKIYICVLKYIYH